MVATGAACRTATITDNEEETKKEITSLLSTAPQVVLLDNVREGLDSAQLAAAVTADPWLDRPFGQNQRMIELPNKATWLVTANNPSLSLEMARRCIRIRIDAKTDRPWERPRSVFKHPDFKKWLSESRPQLVHAVLTLIRTWLAAGRPRGTRTLGSFESWAAVMGGILEVALIPGFLGDCEELYQAADVESAEWRAFCAVWWERFQGIAVKPAELLKLAQGKELLANVLGDKSERSQATRLGKALQRMRDRQFGEWRIVSEPDAHAKGTLLHLVRPSALESKE
jgi:putative DNA primase/helicase